MDEMMILINVVGRDLNADGGLHWPPRWVGE